MICVATRMHLLCTPKSGNAAANEDRKKLFAAKALAAYDGSAACISRAQQSLEGGNDSQASTRNVKIAANTRMVLRGAPVRSSSSQCRSPGRRLQGVETHPALKNDDPIMGTIQCTDEYLR